MRQTGWGTVSPAHEEADHFELGADGSALEGPEEGGKAWLREEHLAEPQLAVAGAWVRESHVKFDEEHGCDKEVLISPESLVVYQPDPSRRVTDIEREPEFFDRNAGLRREEEAFGGKAVDYLIHCVFPVYNHTQPAETRHEAGLIWKPCERPRRRVPDAKVFVAAEDEYTSRLAGSGFGLVPDHGREACIN